MLRIILSFKLINKSLILSDTYMRNKFNRTGGDILFDNMKTRVDSGRFLPSECHVWFNTLIHYITYIHTLHLIHYVPNLTKFDEIDLNNFLS